jgi:phage protein D
MLRPTYAVSLGGRVLSSAALEPLVSLEVSTTLRDPADCVVVRLREVPDVLPDEGAEVTVVLGWDGDDELVFTGTVASVERGLAAVTVVCLGNTAALMRARGDEAFLNQSAGRVVRALASESGVPTGVVKDGIDLPVYLVDSASSHFDHCSRLARRSGFDLYTTVGGELTFAEFAVFFADHTFRYGADLLGLRLERAPAPLGAKVVPESPSSKAGDDTTSWLSRDSEPFTASAGGEPATLLADPLLRSKEAADSTAASLTRLRARDATTGEVALIGSPAVALGDAISFEGVPGGAGGVYQVTAVRHRLDRQRGFRTDVSFGGTDA